MTTATTQQLTVEKASALSTSPFPSPELDVRSLLLHGLALADPSPLPDSLSCSPPVSQRVSSPRRIPVSAVRPTPRSARHRRLRPGPALRQPPRRTRPQRRDRGRQLDRRLDRVRDGLARVAPDHGACPRRRRRHRSRRPSRRGLLRAHPRRRSSRLSYHDPIKFRIDPSTMPPAQQPGDGRQSRHPRRLRRSGDGIDARSHAEQSPQRDIGAGTRSVG